MKLYDDIITRWGTLFNEYPCRALKVKKEQVWEDIANQNFVLRSDMAYELGGSSSDLMALGGTAITDNGDLVPKDEIILIGDDIPDIKSDVSYGRIAIARVNSKDMGQGNALYNAIRKIEYVRYHVNPKGFMMRVSAFKERECVRVSRTAIEEGLDFEKVGNVMLKAFHENSKVEAVKLIFITDPNFDFKRLKADITKSEEVTKAIDHIMKNVVMDCNTCSLQEICDEVEGMKELHFGTATEQQ